MNQPTAPHRTPRLPSVKDVIESLEGPDLPLLSGMFLSTISRTSGGAPVMLLYYREETACLDAARGIGEDWDRRKVRFRLPEEAGIVRLEDVVEGAEVPPGQPPYLHLPLRMAGRRLGALLVSPPPGREFDAQERAALDQFAGICAITMDVIRLLRSTAFDETTGLHSAGHFLSRLREETSRAGRYGRPLSLLFVDVDRYDVVRKVSGRAVTTEIVQVLAGILKETLRKADIVGRVRDRLFAVIFPETPAAGVVPIAQRLAQRMQEQKFGLPPHTVEITLSQAVLSYPADGDTAEAILGRAEEWLTAAQRGGGDRIIHGDTPPPEQDETSRSEGLDRMILSREGRALLALVTRLAAAPGASLQDLLAHMIATVVDVTGADAGIVALLEPTGEPSEEHVATHGAPTTLVMDDVIRAIEKKAPLLVEAPDGMPIVYCPLLSEEGAVGILALHGGPGASPLQEELPFLESSLPNLAGILQGAKDRAAGVAELARVQRELEGTREQLQTKYAYDRIVGRSGPMRQLFHILDRVIDTHHPVLIEGESGTGKELVARAIHYNGPRRNKNFVAENCAALPGTLLEAELFGYVRGAFTGAVADKQGLLEVADEGTLFLDEIGEMSLEMQTKLLRVLEEKEFRPLGGRNVVRVVDVRILSATNRTISTMVQDNLFREDLYYRLNVVKIVVPPLRERIEDLPILADYILQGIAQDTQTPKKRLAPDALALLTSYDWPGNVRELENIIKNVCVFADRPVLDLSAFQHLERLRPDRAMPRITKTGDPRSAYKRLTEAFNNQEQKFIRQLLETLEGNKLQAAKKLGITRPAFYRLLKRLGLYK